MDRLARTVALAAAMGLLLPASAFGAVELSVTPVTPPGDVDSLREGEMASFTVKASNTGTDPAPSPKVTFSLPAGLGFDTASSPAAWTADPSPAPAGATVEFTTPTLAAGANADLSVLVAADSPGVYTIDVDIESDGTPANNALSYPVRVRGLSASSVAFGSQGAGTFGTARTVTVLNESMFPSVFSTLTVTGPNGGDFLRTGDTCTRANLNPTQGCTVTLKFAPEGVGNRSAQIVFDPAGTDVDTAVASLTGVATPAPAPPRQPALPPRPPVIVEVPGPAKLAAFLVKTRLRARAGKRVTLPYIATAAGTAKLEVLRRRRVIATVTRAAKEGRNSLRWRSRRKAKPGAYRLRLTVVAGGQTVTRTAKLRLTRAKRR